jgi:integrase/recombinase XerD
MQYLTMDQVHSILRKAYKSSRRDWLMILLQFTHGLRRGEIARLKLADMEDGKIRVARLKGSLCTTHPLRESKNFLFDEKVALKAWLEERVSDSDALFPSRKGDGPVNPNSVSNLVSAHMRAAGIPRELAHSHSLRHSCCSIMARNGIGIEYIAAYVGHADIKNTRIYLNITSEEAAEKAHSAFNVSSL